MNIRSLVRVFVLAVASLMFHAASATDLRGQVSLPVNSGYGVMNVPQSGVMVTLAGYTNLGLAPIAQSLTNAIGLYFFMGVMPGNYVLIIGPRQYPINVYPAPLSRYSANHSILIS